LLHQNYLRDREPDVTHGYARQAERRLAKLPVDVVFSPSTVPIAYLESDLPVAFWTDSTFAGMVDFYPEFTNLCGPSLRSGHALEAAALQRAAVAVYSSEWAAETARTVYGAPAQKVHVVPFGANLEAAPSASEVRQSIEQRSDRVCKLLFLGAAWYRKGGDVAVEIARELNLAGLPTELVVIGARPRLSGPVPGFVRYEGMISRSSPDRLARYNELLADAHFLVLPTRADCTPVVFSEANAFGVPCVTSSVGGITSIIRTDVNGAAFPADATPFSYCDYISALFNDRRRYQALALAAHHEYETRLNWTVSGRAVTELLRDAIG
jgi:glycosyltransferase involved in cell wall biosynthesis